MSGKTFHFLLIFDHEAGRLVGDTMFTDSAAAVRAYAEAEQAHEDAQFEVVLVGADSIETIMKTHGSYFGPADFSEFLLTP